MQPKASSLKRSLVSKRLGIRHSNRSSSSLVKATSSSSSSVMVRENSSSSLVMEMEMEGTVTETAMERVQGMEEHLPSHSGRRHSPGYRTRHLHPCHAACERTQTLH